MDVMLLVVVVIAHGAIVHFARRGSSGEVIAAAVSSCFLIVAIAAFRWFRAKSERRAELVDVARKTGYRSHPSVSEGKSATDMSLSELIDALAKQLSEMRERERLIADYSQDVHLTLDGNLVINAINPAVKRHWGYEATNCLERNVMTLLPESAARVTADELKQAFDQGSSKFECQLQRADGTIRDTAWAVEYSRADSLLYCIVTDVSERKEAERVKQKLFGMIGHDIRVPLTSVQLSLDLLSHEDLSAYARKVLGRARTSIDRVVRLASDMLDLQQGESGKLSLKQQVVYLPALIEEVASEFEQEALAGKRSLSVVSQECSVTGDEDRVKQIVANFVSNALKYSIAGGSIRLTAEVLGSFAEIAVHDEGPGISDEDKILLFQPYTRLQPDRSFGSGLGLLLCRFLALAQGGAVGVRNSPDGGACFWLRLPVAFDQA